MAALGGAFLSLGDIHTFTEGMTNGAGYLALVGVIFGNWKTGRTVLACLFFGAATALQFQLPALGVPVPTALPDHAALRDGPPRGRRRRRPAVSAYLP